MGRMKEVMGGFYPSAPGYKEPTTSRDAALKMTLRAPTLAQQIYVELKKAGPRGLTADECATQLGKTEFAIRPRFTELRVRGKIMRDPILKRPNKSGVLAAVWIVS